MRCYLLCSTFENRNFENIFREHSNFSCSIVEKLIWKKLSQILLAIPAFATYRIIDALFEKKSARDKFLFEITFAGHVCPNRNEDIMSSRCADSIGPHASL